MECDSRYYYGLGVESFEKGNVEKALEFYIKSLELRPHFKTYERIFDCMNNLGRYSEAKEYIEKAYQMNKKNDKVVVEYVTLLIGEGNNKLAFDLLNELLQRNASNGPARKLMEAIEKNL